MKPYRFGVPAWVSSCCCLAFATVAVGCGSSGSNPSNGPDSGASDSGSVAIDGGAPKEAGGEKDAATDVATWTPTCTPDSDGGSPSGYPAAHAPFPRVVYGGGGVLTAPEVVTITYPGDSLQTSLEQFGEDVTNTCWWNDVRAGYCETGQSNTACVGTGVVPAKPHVEMTTAPAASYTDTAGGGVSSLQTYIQQQVAAGTWPAPSAGTIYVIFLPASTVVSLDGAQSCTTFGGYHMSTTVTPPGGSATQVAYAVVPRCDAGQVFKSQLDELTFAASHEITEAATDPFVTNSTNGYYLEETNPDDLAWNLFPTGGEVGDLCVDALGEGYGNAHDGVTAMGQHGSYFVQRTWSNLAAMAGGDPCVPVAYQPYFNVAPIAGKGWQQIATVGGSVTFEADAFSTGPTGGPWTISAFDVNSITQQGAVTLTVSPSTTSVSNGDKVMITITVNSQMPQIASGINGAVYIIESVSNGVRHAWPGLITQQQL